MQVYLGFTLIPDIEDGMMSSKNFINREKRMFLRRRCNLEGFRLHT